MRKGISLLIFSLFFVSTFLICQVNSTPAESRKKNLKQLLDYRYRGGFYSFENLFYQTVEYNDFAKKNCVIGIMIVRFEVDCEGDIKNLVIANPLKWGLDEYVQEFLNKTIGKWNTCDDDKYTKFEVPIQFTINDTETNSTDAMLVYQVELVGYKCKPDSYFKEKLEEALKKNNSKKSLKYINELIKRDPYNSELYTIRKEIHEEKNK